MIRFDYTAKSRRLTTVLWLGKVKEEEERKKKGRIFKIRKDKSLFKDGAEQKKRSCGDTGGWVYGYGECHKRHKKGLRFF